MQPWMQVFKSRLLCWVVALRSGQYQQAREALRKDDAFCCLGVLCDLEAHRQIGYWTGNGGFKFGGTLWSMFPPDELIPQRLAAMFSRWNDTQGITFEEIADKTNALWVDGRIKEDDHGRIYAP